MTDAGADRSRSVVDASVALKWALDDEEHVDRAVALRDAMVAGSHELLAPSLWVYELVNGLASATHRGRIDSSMGTAMVKTLMRIGVRLVDPEPAQTYITAVGLGLSAYDAAYVALSDVLEVPLWTADRPLYDACRSTNDVRWLGDFRP